MGEIARKTKLSYHRVLLYLQELLKMFQIVKENEFKNFINISRKLVSDEKDTPFVALALKFAPSILMTYNKKHYKQAELEKRNIKVKTPLETLKELGISVVVAETKLKRKQGLIKFLTKFVSLFKRT